MTAAEKAGAAMSSSNAFTHSTLEERRIILTGITNRSTKTAIAKTIGKDKSAAAKEIKLHRVLAHKCQIVLFPSISCRYYPVHINLELVKLYRKRLLYVLFPQIVDVEQIRSPTFSFSFICRIVCSFSDIQEYKERMLNASGSGWSRAVMDAIGDMAADKKAR